MDYFLLLTTGDLNDTGLCLVKDPPSGMGLAYYRPAFGKTAQGYWPEDAKIYLRDENPGIKLKGLLGNTKSYLLLSSAGKEVVEKYRPGSDVEYLPFTLYNHKRRIHSTDYYCINLLGGFDCLNEDASGIEYDDDGEAVVIDEFVLDPAKLLRAPHLFRVKEKSHNYVFSRELGEAWISAGVANIIGTKLREEEQKGNSP